MAYTQRSWFRAMIWLVLVVFYAQTLNPAWLGYAPQYGAPATRTESTTPSVWQRLLDFMVPAAQAQAAGDLLKSTPDANTTDPYIVQKAAELGKDPARIFAFVRDEIGFESYTGSLRGARGTLWSKAGNALDQASLMIALLRASGVPAQYVKGTLSDELAKKLILSMFSMPCQGGGGCPGGSKKFPTLLTIPNCWRKQESTTGWSSERWFHRSRPDFQRSAIGPNLYCGSASLCRGSGQSTA